MTRKLSDQQDNIAAFYEGIIDHLDLNDGIFLGGPILGVGERHQIQNKLKRLVAEHRDNAMVYRSEDR